MSGQSKERYDLEIPDEGLTYDILDLCFNPSTKTFIASNGILPGMHVLDVGSGSGIMTHYLANLVGSGGQVVSIDISLEQLARARQYCDQKGDKNIIFKEFSVYDLDTFHDAFDVIYCRFVLHHLHSPRLAINIFHQVLNKGGIYIAEEGIISAAFAYPPSNAWHYSRTSISIPEQEKDGLDRDGDFGMKLFYWMKSTGFKMQKSALVQPLLTTYEQKKLLLGGHDAYKETALLHGQSQADWEEQRQELLRLAEDDFSIIGFYQSCQICGVK